MDSHYNKLLEKIITGSGHGSGFNDHPNDWQRFYAFIDMVHKGQREKRPTDVEMGRVLTQMLPGAPSWVEQLLAAYNHGVELLDYVANGKDLLPIL